VCHRQFLFSIRLFSRLRLNREKLYRLTDVSFHYFLLSKQQGKTFEYIYTWFNAWLFSGSDNLWAGLIMNLHQEAENHFGKTNMKVYRFFSTSHGFIFMALFVLSLIATLLTVRCATPNDYVTRPFFVTPERALNFHFRSVCNVILHVHQSHFKYLCNLTLQIYWDSTIEHAAPLISVTASSCNVTNSCINKLNDFSRSS
jgi:hypothetical protein